MLTQVGAPDGATLRRVLDTVFAAPVYRWADDPAPLRYLRSWWHRLGEWLAHLRAGNPGIFRALVIALLAALLLLLAHAAWVIWCTVRGGRRPTAAQAAARHTEPRDASWYYREADRAADAGHLSVALQLAFVGLALTLESEGRLRYHPSKTPAECVRDADLATGERERLGDLVRALYAWEFGGRAFAAADYRRWRADGAAAWHASGS